MLNSLLHTTLQYHDMSQLIHLSNLCINLLWWRLFCWAFFMFQSFSQSRQFTLVDNTHKDHLTDRQIWDVGTCPNMTRLFLCYWRHLVNMTINHRTTSGLKYDNHTKFHGDLICCFTGMVSALLQDCQMSCLVCSKDMIKITLGWVEVSCPTQ